MEKDASDAGPQTPILCPLGRISRISKPQLLWQEATGVQRRRDEMSCLGRTRYQTYTTALQSHEFCGQVDKEQSVDIFCELDPRGRPINLDGEGSEEEEALLLPPPAPVAIPTEGSVDYDNDVEFGAEDGEC